MKTIQEQVHAEPEAKLTVSRGHGAPFGATVRPGGVNFAVFARHAERVHLVLSRRGHEPWAAEIPLDPRLNKTGDVWHVFVHGLSPDTLYGYRVFGPFAPHAGHRFNPDVVVLDPYATSISGGQQWGVPDVPNGDGYTRFTRRGRIKTTTSSTGRTTCPRARRSPGP